MVCSCIYCWSLWVAMCASGVFVCITQFVHIMYIINPDDSQSDTTLSRE